MHAEDLEIEFHLKRRTKVSGIGESFMHVVVAPDLNGNPF